MFRAGDRIRTGDNLVGKTANTLAKKHRKTLHLQQFTHFQPYLQAVANTGLRLRPSADFPQKTRGMESLRGRRAEECGITDVERFIQHRVWLIGRGRELPAAGQ
jgi:hypothetical protein